MNKEKLIIKPNNDYSKIHTLIAYAIFGLAALGIWKIIDLIRLI